VNNFLTSRIDFEAEGGDVKMIIEDEPPTPMTNRGCASEITVTIKDDEKTLREKFLIYDTYEVSDTDPIIKDCINKTMKSFGSEPTDIRVRINLEVL
jgi:hypothetical protein